MSQFNVKDYEISGHKFSFPKTAEVVGAWEEKQYNVPVNREESAPAPAAVTPEAMVDEEDDVAG